MSDIKTKPTTQAYRKGYDRIFGRQTAFRLVGGPFKGKAVFCETKMYEAATVDLSGFTTSIACYRREGDAYVFVGERLIRRD
jgi:hypothetical protein